MQALFLVLIGLLAFVNAQQQALCNEVSNQVKTSISLVGGESLLEMVPSNATEALPSGGRTLLHDIRGGLELHVKDVEGLSPPVQWRPTFSQGKVTVEMLVARGNEGFEKMRRDIANNVNTGSICPSMPNIPNYAALEDQPDTNQFLKCTACTVVLGVGLPIVYNAAIGAAFVDWCITTAGYDKDTCVGYAGNVMLALELPLMVLSAKQIVDFCWLRTGCATPTAAVAEAAVTSAALPMIAN